MQDDFPEFMKKGMKVSLHPEIEEALKRKSQEVKDLINQRVGLPPEIQRSKLQQKVLEAKAQPTDPEWKKQYAPRQVPAFGWKCGDAYKLYKYQSKVTGLVEWIWNSRDGVTPFGLIGKDGTEAQHVDWHEDLYCPNYVPAVGTRIFADRPDFDEKLHQFNLQIVEVDMTLHNMFRHRASFTPWVPRAPNGGRYA